MAADAMTAERAREVLRLFAVPQQGDPVLVEGREWYAALRHGIAALDAVARVKAVHERDHGSDPWSGDKYDVCHGCKIAWPCPTIRALDGEAAR